MVIVHHPWSLEYLHIPDHSVSIRGVRGTFKGFGGRDRIQTCANFGEGKTQLLKPMIYVATLLTRRYLSIEDIAVFIEREKCNYV